MKQMLSNRIKCHRTAMFLATVIHFGYSVLIGLALLQGDPQKSLRCSILHVAERAVYLVSNLILMLYYLHLYRNGRMQSMDIFIFDLQKKIALYCLFLPIGVVGTHNLTNLYICRQEPFPLHTTLIYCTHLVAECLLLWMYFCWYQRELKRYSGGETQSEELTSRNQTTTDSVANQGDTLNN